jgi:hypothetical protein
VKLIVPRTEQQPKQASKNKKVLSSHPSRKKEFVEYSQINAKWAHVLLRATKQQFAHTQQQINF